MYLLKEIIANKIGEKTLDEAKELLTNKFNELSANSRLLYKHVENRQDPSVDDDLYSIYSAIAGVREAERYIIHELDDAKNPEDVLYPYCMLRCHELIIYTKMKKYGMLEVREEDYQDYVNELLDYVNYDKNLPEDKRVKFLSDFQYNYAQIVIYNYLDSDNKDIIEYLKDYQKEEFVYAYNKLFVDLAVQSMELFKTSTQEKELDPYIRDLYQDMVLHTLDGFIVTTIFEGVFPLRYALFEKLVDNIYMSNESYTFMNNFFKKVLVLPIGATINHLLAFDIEKEIPNYKEMNRDEVLQTIGNYLENEIRKEHEHEHEEGCSCCHHK